MSEEQKKVLGVAECDGCDGLSELPSFGKLFHKVHFFLAVVVTCGIGFAIRAAQVETAVLVVLSSFIVLGGFCWALVALVLSWVYWVGGQYMYVFKYNGEIHYHREAPRLGFGDKWYAVVMSHPEGKMTEVEITSPIIRLAFSGWFKTCGFLNVGMSPVKISRPIAFNSGYGRLKIFFTISLDRDHRLNQAEALMVTAEEAMEVFPLINGHHDVRITGRLFEIIALADRSRNVANQVREALELNLKVAQSQADEQHVLYEKALGRVVALSADRAAMKTRIGEIMAGLRASKRCQKSRIGQDVRVALGDMLAVIELRHYEDVAVESTVVEEQAKQLLADMEPLPELLGVKESPANESATAQG